MTKAEQTFRAKVPGLMKRLMAEIGAWGVEDAAACFGNAGGESAGFTKLQEIAPTVKGSRGGYGWFQWTAGRRRSYESWCKKQGLDPADDDANFGFLIVELRGAEKKTVPAVADADGLEAKVKAFEQAFERPGIPHTATRVRWARIAMDAWQAAGGAAPPLAKPRPAPKPAKAPKPVDDVYASKTMIQLVQAKLTDLNYPLGSRNPQTGEFDGKIGTLTRSAIRDFRADNGLPEGEGIDAALVAALETAKPRKLAPERENAPVEKAAKNAPETAANWRTEVLAKYGAAGTLFLAVLDWITKQFSAGERAVQPYLDFAASIPLWIWLLAAVVILVALWWNHRGGRIAGVDAWRSGARL